MITAEFPLKVLNGALGRLYIHDRGERANVV